MFVKEVLNRRNDSKRKISDLISFLRSEGASPTVDVAGEILNALFDEIDNYRNCKILLSESNNKTSIVVGGKGVLVSRAVLVRDAIEEKISIFNELIENKIGGILGVMEQRDSLFAEFNSLDVVISSSDLSTEVVG